MSFCLLCRQQSAQIWILAIRIWFSNCQSPSIQTQQLIAKSNLLQNPTYFTLLEVIYLLSKVKIKYQDASIIVLAVDVLDQSLCVAERPYTKWALSSLSFQNSMKYGMNEEQLISYPAWHTACVDFFTNVLTIDEMQKCDGERSRLQKQCCHSWLKLRGENVYQTGPKQKITIKRIS